MREALAALPKEKLAALLPETSPIDVLVVGKDAKAKAAQGTTASHEGAGRISLNAALALAEDEATQIRSLSRVGLHAEALAASNNWVVSGKRTASGKPLLSNDPHLAPSAPLDLVPGSSQRAGRECGWSDRGRPSRRGDWS